MSPQLSWIGLGNMGRGMAKNLVEKGNLSQPLIIFNRSAARAEELHRQLPPETSIVAASAEDAAAKADIVFTCLSNDQVVRDVYTSIAKSDVKGKLFVDTSTIHPETTEMVAKTILAQGGEFVACPVFGAPAMAAAGQLVCVLAGPREAIEKVRPYCKGVMGRAEIDFSDESYGKATLLKVIGNTFILNMVETLAEGHTVAEKTGLGSKHMHQFVETMFPGPYTAYSKRMMEQDYIRDEPLFSVDLARKDAGHAMELAKAAGARMKGVEVADGHLADVQKHMGSKGDIAGIYGAVRQEAGLSFELHKP